MGAGLLTMVALALGNGGKSGLAQTTQDAPAAPPYQLTGFAREDTSYNYAHPAPAPGTTDYRGWSKLRTTLELDLHLDLPGDWKALVSGQANRDAIYALRGREHYTRQVLDAYEQGAEFREVWLGGKVLPVLDVKLGRQILVWGKADTVRVVDVLNPVDNREPGLVDLRDLRLPVTMARVDAYLGPWNVQAVAIPEVRLNKDPVFGSDFYPSPRFFPERKPADGGENTQYGVALNGVFAGWDLSFYSARYFDPAPHVEQVSLLPFRQELRHARLAMVGAAADVAMGDWVLRWEWAFIDGLRYFNAPGREFERVDTMVGADFSGVPNGTITLELADRHLHDPIAALAKPPDYVTADANQIVLAWRQTLLNERWELVALLSLFGQHADQGNLQRYSARYELAAGLRLTGGVIIYQSHGRQNYLLATAQNNDRLFGDVTWNF